MSGTLVKGKVTVAPAQFVQVKYDAAEIAALVANLAEQLGVSNPIELQIDETTPLAKIVSELDAVSSDAVSSDAMSSDAVIRIAAQSGALENTKVLTTLGPVQTRVAVGRMLLRARDRMRDDFADAPADNDLTREENAAWDTTAPAAYFVPAARSTSSAGATTTATGSASATRSTPTSIGCGLPTISHGPASFRAPDVVHPIPQADSPALKAVADPPVRRPALPRDFLTA